MVTDDPGDTYGCNTSSPSSLRIPVVVVDDDDEDTPRPDLLDFFEVEGVCGSYNLFLFFAEVEGVDFRVGTVSSEGEGIDPDSTAPSTLSLGLLPPFCLLVIGSSEYSAGAAA